MTPLEAVGLMVIAAVILVVAVVLGLSAIWGRRRIPERWTPDKRVDMAALVATQDESNRLLAQRIAARSHVEVVAGTAAPAPFLPFDPEEPWSKIFVDNMGWFGAVAAQRSVRARRRDEGAFQFPPRLRGFPYDQERENG